MAQEFPNLLQVKKAAALEKNTAPGKSNFSRFYFEVIYQTDLKIARLSWAKNEKSESQGYIPLDQIQECEVDWKRKLLLIANKKEKLFEIKFNNLDELHIWKKEIESYNSTLKVVAKEKPKLTPTQLEKCRKALFEAIVFGEIDNFKKIINYFEVDLGGERHEFQQWTTDAPQRKLLELNSGGWLHLVVYYASSTSWTDIFKLIVETGGKSVLSVNGRWYIPSTNTRAGGTPVDLARAIQTLGGPDLTINLRHYFPSASLPKWQPAAFRRGKVGEASSSSSPTLGSTWRGTALLGGSLGRAQARKLSSSSELRESKSRDLIEELLQESQVGNNNNSEDTSGHNSEGKEEAGVLPKTNDTKTSARPLSTTCTLQKSSFDSDSPVLEKHGKAVTPTLDRKSTIDDSGSSQSSFGKQVSTSGFLPEPAAPASDPKSNPILPLTFKDAQQLRSASSSSLTEEALDSKEKRFSPLLDRKGPQSPILQSLHSSRPQVETNPFFILLEKRGQDERWNTLELKTAKRILTKKGITCLDDLKKLNVDELKKMGLGPTVKESLIRWIESK